MSDFQTKENIPEKYRLLSTQEKWRWHASVYAFRRVVLHVSLDERHSPCDAEGKWFNEQMVARAEYDLRQTGRMRSRSYREGKPYGADPAGGREIKEQWCRDHGYRDFREYMDRERLEFADDADYGQACAAIAESIAREATLRGQKAFREHKGARTERRAALDSMGIKARERIYDPEELRRGRIELGLEREAADAAE